MVLGNAVLHPCVAGRWHLLGTMPWLNTDLNTGRLNSVDFLYKAVDISQDIEIKGWILQPLDEIL